ncbi:hypothetical protein HYPSUDRAFT_61326 [Hypholoma sublateritium FD-334 SS-4]|uniref:Seipin n=1 Tax=Hypholoma sublateritium (strain FD-334 SS-4) TaxID=945553 RepID=A0A0D2PLS8_HYPSF|nr:hypothetical protein HYPSUDRAFT_61326 [Hypholoma sublateritium FD-334 SS-4]
MSRPEEKSPSPSLLWRVLISPITLGLAVVSRGFSALRPYAPTLIPILVCALFIPLILLLSAFSGWYVWSSLSVSWQVPLYFQYGNGYAPHAVARLPDINVQQRYHISVHLVLPDSAANIALGNFMTSLVLATPGNTSLVSVSRPAIVLPARSSLLFRKPLTSEISVPMLEAFIPTKANLDVAVEIGRRDGWRTLGAGEGREVSVLSASLRGLAVPHGIRGLALRAPLLASVLAAGIFFFILSFTVATCVLPLILPGMPAEESEDEGLNVAKTELTEPSASQYPAQEKERNRRRSRSSRSSREATSRVKVEAPVDIIPSATEDPTRGLRRRSSKPVVAADS